MSRIRIAVSILVAAMFLGSEFVAFWYFNLPSKWIPILLFLFIALSCGLIIERERHKRLSLYWQRTCTGFRWRRRFPSAHKADIREFLVLFVDAFAFRRKRRCCFSPDDRVMEIYRAIYPPGSAVDSMELECLCDTIKKRYGPDFAVSWREDITLGEIYEQTHRGTLSM